MDIAPFSGVALDALRLYQTVDRALYSILVFELLRDPIESLQVVALWLWLEYLGCGHVTRKILASAPFLVNQTAEEAILCLKCIMNSTFINTLQGIDIPLTRTILRQEISVKFFHDRRLIAGREIGRIIKYDCLESLRDLIMQACNGNFAESSSRDWVILPSNTAGQSPSSSSAVTPHNLGQSSGLSHTIPSSNDEAVISSRNDRIIPLNAPRHHLLPIVMPVNHGQSSGSDQVMVPYNNADDDAHHSSRNQIIPYNAAGGILPNTTQVPNNGRQNAPYSIETMTHEFYNMRIGRTLIPRTYPGMNEVPRHDRTMFITFSRGYPVTEREVRLFFTTLYGDCIESLEMQQVRPYEQALYALVVFFRASLITQILGGSEKAKFNINGKHVWIRKYVPRRVPLLHWVQR